MTQTILHIDASARIDGSVTRKLTQSIVDTLDGTVIRRDLNEHLPLISDNWLAANWTPADQRDDVQRDTLALSDTLIAELKAADTLVIGVPMYNFSIPAALKAWMDLVARAGETFRATDSGVEGLLQGKRAVLAVATGMTPVGSDYDYATGYMQHMLGFMGITDIQVVKVDSVAMRGDEAVAEGSAQIAALAA